MTFRSLTLAALLAAAAMPAQAETGDWIVRLRGVVVAPTESSGGVVPTFATSRVGVTDSFAPEIDVTYFVGEAVAFELIAATTKHTATGKNALAPVGDLVKTWVLPPTLTLQYHFAPKDRVSPYVGAGVNYTFFYNEKSTAALNTAIGATRARLDGSFGYALQAGVDVPLGKNTLLNIDVKYIDIDTTATLTTGALVNRVDISLDPVVAGVGIGWRF